jgi:hypothetical protein
MDLSTGWPGTGIDFEGAVAVGQFSIGCRAV